MDFLGPKEMIIWFEKNLWKTFWLLINCSMTFIILNDMGKKLPNIFSSGSSPFFWKVVSVDLLGS